MLAITPTQVAMGLGASGAMVDVSAYVENGDPITYSAGKQDEFRDGEVGRFSFTLNNRDGRFTPNNATGNAAAGYSTTVTEGMAVSWLAGTRLIATSVQSVQLPADETTWGQIVITCDDDLGGAARTLATDPATAMVVGRNAYLYWPMKDAVNSVTASEQSGRVGPVMQSVVDPSAAAVWPVVRPVFGTAAVVGLGPGTQMTLTTPATLPGLPPLSYGSYEFVASSGFPAIAYASGSLGFHSLMVNLDVCGPIAGAVGDAAPWQYKVRIGGREVRLQFQSTSFQLQQDLSVTLVEFIAPMVNRPTFVSVRLTHTYLAPNYTITASLFIDGVLIGSVPTFTTTSVALTYAGFWGQATATDVASTITVSHVSHTEKQLNIEALRLYTEAGYLTAWSQMVSGMTLDTLPTDMSTAPVADDTSTTVLSKMTAAIRTEQGAIYSVTTGTLLAPVQKIRVRARTRPVAVSYSFNALTEVSDVPAFIRDLTNMVSVVTAQGPSTSSTYTDPTLTARVGSAGVSESILNSGAPDQLGWAQDRAQRGKNTNLRVVSVMVDALTTPTDRSADLLGMVFGDRIQITNLPSTTLGFTTWDGWFIGRSEIHQSGENAQNRFQMFLQPVLPATAIFDTNRFMADGALTLSAAIATTIATTMSVATSGPKLETVDVPYTLLVDSEQVTVTACTSAIPQVATITRGVNGTTAATHTTSASIEVVAESLFAF